MSGQRRPWATALVAYAVYRRTLSTVSGRHQSPRRTLLVRMVIVTLFLLVMPVAGPILWQAIIAMPAALVFFLVSATVFRVVRWYWRRQP